MSSRWPSASVCEAELKAHLPLHLELLARPVVARFLIQASYWKPSCIAFVLVKIACGPTGIESIPTTPPTTPALRQPGNKLNYLSLCCASFPLSPYTMLRCIPDIGRRKIFFPSAVCASDLQHCIGGRGGEQSPRKRVVKFVAGRMVFPGVGHPTLMFELQGVTSENSTE